jgi:acetyl esterase/lipase
MCYYRLVPEYPFPSCLEDALDAYDFLLADGIDPANIAVAWDSAGGGLALSLLYQVDSEDAAFLLLEQPENPAHISLVALYDQTPLQGAAIRFQHILQHIENRLNSTPVFYQKISRVVAACKSSSSGE